ncbi:hypothetical protein UlMin_012401 [Ulmus minor]
MFMIQTHGFTCGVDDLLLVESKDKEREKLLEKCNAIGEEVHCGFIEDHYITDYNPEHSLIIPKSHYPSLEATPPSVIAAMCSKVPFISSAMLKPLDSFNLLVNNGEATGQTHIHIIPCKAHDFLWASEHSMEPDITAASFSRCLLENCCTSLLSYFELYLHFFFWILFDLYLFI